MDRWMNEWMDEWNGWVNEEYVCVYIYVLFLFFAHMRLRFGVGLRFVLLCWYLLVKIDTCIHEYIHKTYTRMILFTEFVFRLLFVSLFCFVLFCFLFFVFYIVYCVFCFWISKIVYIDRGMYRIHRQRSIYHTLYVRMYIAAILIGW